MSRLVIVVEGKSELRLVRTLIGEHLGALGIPVSVYTVATGTDPRTGGAAKGGGGWKPQRQQIQRALSERDSPIVTTLFDLYRFDFPGRPPAVVTAEAAEEAMAADLNHPSRFRPYVQRHEFETFAFVDLGQLQGRLEADEDQRVVQRLMTEVGPTPPEDINGDPATAPSSRLARIPSFGRDPRKSWKLAFVVPAVEAIGLERLRATCPRFDAWLCWMESLAP